jgi:hypothetical protein
MPSWMPEDLQKIILTNKGDDTYLRDPKNYKFLPYEQTKKI